ncbi:MAG: hypothetical protein ACJ0J6_05150 [Dehalococcoidia bacterium]
MFRGTKQGTYIRYRQTRKRYVQQSFILNKNYINCNLCSNC